MKKKILFIEDEPLFNDAITYLLEKENYTVYSVLSGEEGISVALKESPDLVLLDISLPGIDGYEVCRLLRKEQNTRNTPIIFLTARNETNDILRGLYCQSDDYITKPVLHEVLLARISSLFRRMEGLTQEKNEIILIHNLRIDPAAFEVYLDKSKVKLTKTEFDILYLLASHPNKVFTRVEIIEKLRGGNVFINERVVDVELFGLRKKLGKAGHYIETIRGVGYKIVV